MLTPDQTDVLRDNLMDVLTNIADDIGGTPSELDSVVDQLQSVYEKMKDLTADVNYTHQRMMVCRGYTFIGDPLLKTLAEKMNTRGSGVAYHGDAATVTCPCKGDMEECCDLCLPQSEQIDTDTLDID